MKKLNLIRLADLKDVLPLLDREEITGSKAAEMLNTLANDALEQEIDNLFSSVTRVEVVDSGGRSYVNWHTDNTVDLHLQDNDRTLKVFIYKKI